MSMPLIKIKTSAFSLCFFIQIGFSQNLYRINEIAIIDLKGKKDFSPDLITVSNKQIFVLDKKSRLLAKIQQDTLHTVGGFGGSSNGMFDPVDLLVNQLDVFVLDQSLGKISRFDFNLNLIQRLSISNDEPKYPSCFNIDSKRNILFYSKEEDIVYKTKSISSKFSPFIDMNFLSISQNCLIDFAVNKKDNYAAIFSCINQLSMFNRNGKPIRRFKLDLINPFKVLWFDNVWAVFNNSGQLQIQHSQVLDLGITNAEVLDVARENNSLYLLTNTSIQIFEISKIPF